MEQINELRKVVEHRASIEAELADLHAKAKAMQQEIRRLSNIAQSEQEDVEKLQGFSVKGLLLGLTGRKEARLEQEQREARAARADLDTANFHLESVKKRISDLERELLESRSKEDAYISRIEAMAADTTALTQLKERCAQMEQVYALRSQIRETGTQLKAVVEKAIYTCTYGDIQVDAIGNRYNRKESTLKTQSKECEKVLAQMLELLARHNALAPEELAAETDGPWTGKSAYLTEPLSDREVFDRLDGLQFWVQRLERARQRTAERLDEITYTRRNELRNALFAIHDHSPSIP